MEWQIFMTFAFTRRDVVIVPWRSDGGGGGGGGGWGISRTWLLSYGYAEIIWIRFWQRVSK